MKNKTKLGIIFVLVFLMSVSTVSAQNQFQDIIDLIADVFDMVEQVFTLPLFETPQGAFGLILAMVGIIIFTILYAGASAIGLGSQRIRITICAAFTAMTIILMNFRKEFFWAIFGNWMRSFLMLLILLFVGVCIYASHRLPRTRGGNWMRALLYLIAFFIVMYSKTWFKNKLDFFIGFAPSYSPPIILAPFMFNKKKRKIFSFVFAILCILPFVTAQTGSGGSGGLYIMILSIVELVLLFQTIKFAVKGTIGSIHAGARSDEMMAVGGRLRKWGNRIKERKRIGDSAVQYERKYNAIRKNLMSNAVREERDHILPDIQRIIDSLKMIEKIDEEIGVN